MDDRCARHCPVALGAPAHRGFFWGAWALTIGVVFAPMERIFFDNVRCAELIPFYAVALTLVAFILRALYARHLQSLPVRWQAVLAAALAVPSLLAARGIIVAVAWGVRWAGAGG